ncbi:RAC family serine/threonine-protein kinase homolog [Hyperolius riggenbachi]|uniref:RAC family serine/threonine-protein kinase homolog n=1 Tax=Hyperolius riggenbachi TaxID=752182 RepID=UPI0035A29795
MRCCVEGLLCQDPEERQTLVKDIRDHPFFQKINWKELEAGKCTSPVVVRTGPETEASEDIDIDAVLPPTDPASRLSPEEQQLFSGFSCQRSGPPSEILGPLTNHQSGPPPQTEKCA